MTGAALRFKDGLHVPGKIGRLCASRERYEKQKEKPHTSIFYSCWASGHVTVYAGVLDRRLSSYCFQRA